MAHALVLLLHYCLHLLLLGCRSLEAKPRRCSGFRFWGAAWLDGGVIRRWRAARIFVWNSPHYSKWCGVYTRERGAADGGGRRRLRTRSRPAPPDARSPATPISKRFRIGSQRSSWVLALFRLGLFMRRLLRLPVGSRARYRIHRERTSYSYWCSSRR